MTLRVVVESAAAQRSSDLAGQIIRFEAAERKPAGRSQPELTGLLLLPFHSDDVIISYNFVRIFFSTSSTTKLLFSRISFEHRFDFRKNDSSSIFFIGQRPRETELRLKKLVFLALVGETKL